MIILSKPKYKRIYKFIPNAVEFNTYARNVKKSDVDNEIYYNTKPNGFEDMCVIDNDNTSIDKVTMNGELYDCYTMYDFDKNVVRLVPYIEYNKCEIIEDKESKMSALLERERYYDSPLIDEDKKQKDKVMKKMPSVFNVVTNQCRPSHGCSNEYVEIQYPREPQIGLDI
ncbi:MAG: hypothetical protein PHY47_12710 [Lachnospiraceae bacterium]|nr:hypothetical protein [Lachnospiraceae bacterium]